MNNHLANLARRRLELLRKIEVQRTEMVDIFAHLQKPLLVIGAGVRLVRFVRSYPVLMVGGLTAMLMWHRKGNPGRGQKWWQILYSHPALISFGMKSLSSAAHRLGKEQKVPFEKTQSHQIR